MERREDQWNTMTTRKDRRGAHEQSREAGKPGSREAGKPSRERPASNPETAKEQREPPQTGYAAAAAGL